MHEKRFNTGLGEYYELFKLAVPHYDKLEDVVGDAVRGFCSGRPSDSISVLEMGCGTGMTTQRLLAADPRIVVTAVDSERVMLKQAERALREYISTGRLRLVHNDGLEYMKSLEDGSFDIFASAFVIHNFDAEYRKLVLKETWRVLAPGGLFVNGDKYARDDTAEHGMHMEWQLKRFDVFESIGRPELKQKWLKHYHEDNSPCVVMREGDFVKTAESIGFSQLRKIYGEHMEAVYIASK